MKYILLFSLALSLSLCSCQKFLEEVPTSSLTTDSKVTSRDAGIAFASGSYRGLGFWANGVNWIILENHTGKVYSQAANYSGLWEAENDLEAGNNSWYVGFWNNWYTGVRDCNLAIERIPTIDGLSESEKSKYLGEVRALRAFYYHNLVRLFGDVVYNTSSLRDISKVAQPRTSLKTIYDKIIVPDLEFAVNESALEDVRSSTGRVTKHVARIMLADVYLTMAGYPYQEVNADPDTTKQWCIEGLWRMKGYPVNTTSAKEFLMKAKVQLDFLYDLYPLGNFRDLGDPTMDNKGGCIFGVQYLEGVLNNTMMTLTLPAYFNLSMFSVERGYAIPSQSYYNSFNPADIRIKDRVYFYYSDNLSKKYDANESPAPKFPMPYLYKYYDIQACKVTGVSGLDWPLYRYADVLLMLTEVNWTLKQLGEAIPDNDIVKGINEVRTRAGLGTYLESTLTLLDIMSERAYELIFENKILWDMRRTRKVLIDGSGQFSGIEDLVGHQPISFKYKFSEQHLLSPVSSTEIDNNINCLQNFGYLPKQIGQ